MGVKIVQVSPANKKARAFAAREWKKFNRERGYEYDEKKFSLVAYEGKRIVGYAKLNMIGGGADLRQLVVSKAFRREGVGSMLLEEAEKLMKSKGCHVLHLDTSERHREALNFYRKRGYRLISTLKNYNFHLTWYEFEKYL